MDKEVTMWIVKCYGTDGELGHQVPYILRWRFDDLDAACTAIAVEANTKRHERITLQYKGYLRVNP